MKDKRIRVLFVPHWYPTKENRVSGIFIERQVKAVSKYCDVAVLHVEISSENLVSISKDNGYLEVIVYKKNRRPLSLTSFIGYLQGYKTIKELFGQIDLFHMQVLYLGSGIFVLLESILSKKPYIISEHSSMFVEENGTFRNYSSIKKSLIRLIANKSKAIIVVSNFLKQALEKNKINNIHVIPNIVDYLNYKSIKKNGEIKNILHISLLNDSVKNISGVLDALNEISQKRRDFKLDIIGDGKDRSFLEDKAKNYGLLGRTVFFQGIKSPLEVSHYISKCDFLVTNSNYETFSVATAEALAYGKPVIATRCGGPEDYVDKSNGLLINPKDKKALASAIEYMLDNHEKYDTKLIRKEAKNKFSSEVIGERIFGFYINILNKK